MRLIVLGSGSTGNVLLIESGGARVLVDAGLTAKETARRIAANGLDPTRLDGIVITHEHSDHIKGAAVLSKTTGAPVFMSAAARSASSFPNGGEGIVWGERVSSSEPFQIGPMEFYPFGIPHDGADTFAVTVKADGIKAGIVTDLGYITQLAAERLRGCDFILIESNHDLDLLKVGPYPWSVKQRIASRLGHLSNDETSRWLREDFDGQARFLVLAHLSRRCNHPELARLAALRALKARGASFFPDAEKRVTVANHDRASEWFEF